MYKLQGAVGGICRAWVNMP